MPQLAKDIIARAAWEVGDEYFKYIKQPEMVSSLDRVYRHFCRETKILRGDIGFRTTASQNEYVLYGSTDVGGTFGDDFFQLFRVEYNQKRAQEVLFEVVKNLLIQGLITRDDDSILYAVNYMGQHKVMYFPFPPADQDEVELWYYTVPRIGTIDSLSSTFAIDDLYTDDLVSGLTILARKKMIRSFADLHRKDGIDIQKDFNMVQFHVQTLATEIAEYKVRLLEIGREVAGYGEENTPVVAEITTPFTDVFDDFLDTDYSDL